MENSDDGLTSVEKTAKIIDAGFMTIRMSPNTSFAENITNTTSQNSTTPFRITENEAFPSLMNIYFVVTAFMVMFGLLGNVFTIIIMRREPFRSNSYGIHLTALAVSDMLSLIITTLAKDSTNYLLGKGILAQSALICKIFGYSIISMRMFASSNVVYICVERFIAVWFPFKAKHLLTKRSAIIISGCTFVAASIVGMVASLEFVVKFGSCLPYDISTATVPITVTIGGTLHIAIPTVTLLLLTPLIIFKLVRNQLLRRRMTNNRENGTEQLTHITAMLIGTVIAYIVLVTCPVGARLVLRHTRIAPVELQILGLQELTFIPEQINCAGNFVIYGLLCSEFRNHFIDICRAACRMRTEERI